MEKFEDGAHNAAEKEDKNPRNKEHCHSVQEIPANGLFPSPGDASKPAELIIVAARPDVKPSEDKIGSGEYTDWNQCTDLEKRQSSKKGGKEISG